MKNFNEPIVITKRNHEDFENSIKCWIFKKEYKEGEVRLRDHNPITGKYGGSAHQDCNLNLSLMKQIYTLFHILEKYDLQLIF